MEIHDPAVAYGNKKFTIEEYLELEQNAEEKHEYFKGEVFAMSGAKVPHNIITGNLYSEIKQKLKGKSCRPFNSDQRIHIPSNSLFTYPDISIVCGEIETRENDNWNLLNPSILVEVLSPSTRSYDMGIKFSLYRDIQTLREYIMVDSELLHIHAFRINSSGYWELQECKKIEDHLLMQSILITIPLSDIYEGGNF